VRRRAERGFTLIELMVALIISSLLVGMILAIFSRMSMAYRGQQQIAGVQQVLSAARASIEYDAKQAGLGMSQGFTIAGDSKLHQAVKVEDSSTGPDKVYFYYGDPSVQAAITSTAQWTTLGILDVDSITGFAPDDLVLLSTPDLTAMTGLNPANDANIAKFTACVAQIATVVPGTAPAGKLRFATSAPWGKPGNTQCAAPVSGTTMIYKFVARAYRIDTSSAARAAIGPLQQTTFGGLLDSIPGGFADTWYDLAYGFTDLQTSLQVYDANTFPGDTPDPDLDGARDWYSGAMQTTMTADTPTTPLNAKDGLLQMSISLVARTDREIEGISTPATPPLMDPANPGNLDNNTVGNRVSIPLPSQPPWLADPALQGSRIYRYVTFQVDLRNLGVGR
jgi:prepilin-type N-terminal cleavage/methylation domain-containing protein